MRASTGATAGDTLCPWRQDLLMRTRRSSWGSCLATDGRLAVRDGKTVVSRASPFALRLFLHATAALRLGPTGRWELGPVGS